MSTIFFGIDELANVIVVATSARLPNERWRIRSLANLLATYSYLNAEAYKIRYANDLESREIVGYTAQDIEAWVLAMKEDGDNGSFAQAAGFLQLAAYNLDDFDFREMRGMLDGLRIAVMERLDRYSNKEQGT